MRLARQGEDEPLDLMDDGALLSMLRSEEGGRGRGAALFGEEAEEGPAYGRAEDGRLVVKEEHERKRGREEEGDEDGRSQGGRSRSTRAPASSKRVRTGPQLHSADRFRPKKGGAKGDVSKTGQQPYAYWPLDAKLLNRRAGRRREAAAGLDQVVSAVKRAGNKGGVAKRR
jgi:ribosomal RNA-processing protein 12